jgi:DNA-binding transcriptional LysR family regulator
VAQPSLSVRLRDLERELGVDLFHRVGRGVRLTAAGDVVVEHARQVLAQVAILRAAAADVAGNEAGTLDVVSLPLLAVDPLAELTGRFRRAHPKVAVRIAETDDATDAGGVAGWVRSGRAEIGLAELPVTGGDLVVSPLADQELLVIGAPGTLAAEVALRDLAGAPLILTPPGTSSRRLVEAAFAGLGLEVAIAVEVAPREAVVPLVLAGAGVGFVPGAQARAAVAQGASVARPDPPLVRRIGLLLRPGPASPAARAFLAEALEPSAGEAVQPKRPVM